MAEVGNQGEAHPSYPRYPAHGAVLNALVAEARAAVGFADSSPLALLSYARISALQYGLPGSDEHDKRALDILHCLLAELQSHDMAGVCTWFYQRGVR